MPADGDRAFELLRRAGSEARRRRSRRGHGAICAEFEAYGWRRVQAALRLGHRREPKKIKRLMREHDLHPRTPRRFVRTTGSDHDQPIFPDRTKELTVDGPNQLWVADLTYVAIAVGFVYLAVILDAWSRRVIGYAIGRSIEARLTVAALRAAIKGRKPPPGCIHHFDRGSPVRREPLPRASGRARPDRFDGAPRQPIRQRERRKAS
jgi:putative transposase